MDKACFGGPCFYTADPARVTRLTDDRALAGLPDSTIEKRTL